MRALFTKLPFAFLGLALLASCGKENASGGGSSSLSAGVSISGSTNINQLRSAFNNTSLSYGISQDTEIYHAGPYFKTANNSNCKDIDLWGFDLGSYCYGSYQSEIDLYEIKIVQSTSSGSLIYKEPVESNPYGQGYVLSSDQTFDRGATRYKEMLAQASNSPVEVRTSNATITLSNGQTKKGVYVEYFYGTKTNNILNITSMDAFVLSTEMAVIANPIIVEKNGNLVGRLGKIGTSTISQVKVSNSHYLGYEYSNENGYTQMKSVIRSRGQERTF